MADLTSYSGLCAAVADYLGRSDLTERIPTFIALAERRMNRELRLRAMERRAVLDVDPNTEVVSLPWRRIPGDWDCFLEMRDLTWLENGERKNLIYRPTDDYRQFIATGSPAEYTIIGRDLFLLPVPDTGGTLYLTYYAEIPPLGSAQTDNEVLMAYPDLYLYASLVESAPFTRGSAPLEVWTEYYTAARAKVTDAENRARYTSNIKMHPIRRV